MRLIFSLCLISLWAAFSFAQVDSFKIDFNFRTRAEVDNGFKTLLPKGKKTETNIYARARMGFNYYYHKLELRFAGQDVRVWGEAGSTVAKGVNFTLFDAWAKYQFTSKVAFKVGRQELSYDDERLLGALDWVMQGRRFDAVKGIFALNGQSKLEIVGTYNNDDDDTNDLRGTEFYKITEAGERTKSIQVIHYQHQPVRGFSFSGIGLNNIVQSADGTHRALATVGVHLKQRISPKISLYGSAYYQFGRNTQNQEKKAYQASFNMALKPVAYWHLTIGGEWLSGTGYDADKRKNNSFSPLYGTNHKFNGFMDYFFVGNYFNSFGLNDYYLNNTFTTSSYNNLYVSLHYLSSNALSQKDMNRYLGTELDLVFTHKFNKQFVVNLGYSHLFYSDNMKLIKAVANPASTQFWAWLSLGFTPQFRLK